MKLYTYLQINLRYIADVCYQTCADVICTCLVTNTVLALHHLMFSSRPDVGFSFHMLQLPVVSHTRGHRTPYCASLHLIIGRAGLLYRRLLSSWLYVFIECTNWHRSTSAQLLYLQTGFDMHSHNYVPLLLFVTAIPSPNDRDDFNNARMSSKQLCKEATIHGLKAVFSL